MLRPCVAGLGAMLAVGLCAHAVARAPVEDIRGLLIAALDDPAGRAKGTVSGQMGEIMQQHFGTTAPLLVDVVVLHRYMQPGCGRLNVQFRQDGLRIKQGAAPEIRTIDFGLNFCRDGLPPKSLERAS